MNARLSTQLDKVLAMADSSHDSEALVAIRKARQLLSRDGLNFSDLAKAAIARPRLNLPFSLFSGQHVHLEIEVAQLQQKLADLKADLHKQSIQVEFWRHRATELEQNLNLSAAQSSRWRTLARETVEKLWDLGQSVSMEEFAAQKPDPSCENPRKTA